jgi:hydrogenase maturation protease
MPVTSAHTLVAGIGNIFFGDDGFGVAVVSRLSSRPRKANVDIADFGIRGIDLAYALAAGYDDVILVDATARGGPPGTLYVLESEIGAHDDAPDLAGHDLIPTQALALARRLGAAPARLRIVACEPGDASSSVGLSPAVEASIEPAVTLIEDLLDARDA